MKLTNVIGKRDPMIFGHFIEHFHRQVYGGILDPTSPLSDEDGFRTDVIEAIRKVSVPILRWPGGCFVSSYHWKDAVGNKRSPMFDKAWRVEDGKYAKWRIENGYKNPHKVKYWSIGNENYGEWEIGAYGAKSSPANQVWQLRRLTKTHLNASG